MLIKASRVYGIGLSLLAISAFGACSSDPETNTGGTAGTSTGTAGTLGSAGTTVGTAGTGTGTAGTGTGMAGTSSTAGTTGAGGTTSTAACTKPTSATVTEFADLTPNAMSAGNYTFMAGVPGGTFSYQAGKLTSATTGMAFNVKGKIDAYDGFGVYTNACTDATGYTGVSFNIKGNPGPSGKVNFRVQTNATTAVDPVNKKGTCMVPAGTTDTYPLCHPSAVDVPVTAGGAVVNVKFSDLMGGVPVAAVDGKDIVGFEWAFAWAGATDTAYDADVTIDDIKFTGGTSGGTGAGGSAGSGGSGGAAAGSGGSGGSGGSAAGSGGTGGTN